MSEIHMTKDEFRKHVDQAFINGSTAAFDTLIEVIGELRKRLDEATPGDIGHDGGQGV